MASTVKGRLPTKKKLSFRDQLEKRRMEMEELMTVVTAVQELRLLLAQSIKDPDIKFGSEQSEIPILTEEERLFVKERMLDLIKKHF